MHPSPTDQHCAESELVNTSQSVPLKALQPHTEPLGEPSNSNGALESPTHDAASVSVTRRTAIFLQDACLRHIYIRSRDTSSIVERPERLRAVKIGLAAAVARLEEAARAASTSRGSANDHQDLPVSDAVADPDALIAAFDRLSLGAEDMHIRFAPISVFKSSATVNLLDNAAVKYIHGDIDGDVYLEKLKAWARDSYDNILKRGSEIPEQLPQNDLYLCPTSIDAVEGAIGTISEAIDAVFTSSSPAASNSQRMCERAFVAVRPPGHHCGEDTPCGFCFVNNVAVGAAHAHLQHGVQRIIILDIDLHHGNGTQSITWQINEETYRQTLESELTESDIQPSKKGPQIYYGSLHDVLSFPCEDGKPDLVQAASVSLHGLHGQHIENVHLQPYSSEAHFWDVLYKKKYTRLLSKAEDFLEKSGGPGDDVLIFISCGFDACEHEYPSMSRHNRKVPTSFYRCFARDACALAERYARGRIVSVLEGGYSDRALTSGAMAHLVGLTDVGALSAVDETWWSVENLVKLEKATKKRKGGGRPSVSGEPWLDRTVALFSAFEAGTQYLTPSISRSSSVVPPSLMTLRERKKMTGKADAVSAEPSPSTSPAAKRTTAKKAPAERIVKSDSALVKDELLPVVLGPGSSANSTEGTLSTSGSSASVDQEELVVKKLPRVILRLGPAPTRS